MMPCKDRQKVRMVNRMKRVIEINEEAYDWLANGFPDDEDCARLIRLLQESTPLSEPEDCVSRQLLIETMCSKCTVMNKENCIYKQGLSGGCTEYETIMQLPPVTPKQRTGHWRDTGSGQECSECGEIQYGYDNFRKYCANCGAKMEV